MMQLSCVNFVFPADLFNQWERLQIIGRHPITGLLYLIGHSKIDNHLPFSLCIWSGNPNVPKSWVKVKEIITDTMIYGFMCAMNENGSQICILNSVQSAFDVRYQTNVISTREEDPISVELPQEEYGVTLCVYDTNLDEVILSEIQLDSLQQLRQTSTRFGTTLIHSCIGLLTYHEHNLSLRFVTIDYEENNAQIICQTLESVNINSAVQSVALGTEKICILVESFDSMTIHLFDLKEKQMGWTILRTDIDIDIGRYIFLLCDKKRYFGVTFTYPQDDTQDQLVSITELLIDCQMALQRPIGQCRIDMSVHMNLWTWFSTNGIYYDINLNQVLYIPERYPFISINHIQPSSLKRQSTIAIQKLFSKEIEINCYDWMWIDPLWCVPPLLAFNGGIAEDKYKQLVGAKKNNLFAL